MCYNCGCFNPQDKMGHDDNITDSTFQQLAKTWGKSIDETKKTVLTAIEENKTKDYPELITIFKKAAKAWGQTVEEAQENTKDLLSQ